MKKTEQELTLLKTNLESTRLLLKAREEEVKQAVAQQAQVNEPYTDSTSAMYKANQLHQRNISATYLANGFAPRYFSVTGNDILFRCVPFG